MILPMGFNYGTEFVCRNSLFPSVLAESCVKASILFASYQTYSYVCHPPPGDQDNPPPGGAGVASCRPPPVKTSSSRDSRGLLCSGGSECDQTCSI